MGVGRNHVGEMPVLMICLSTLSNQDFAGLDNFNKLENLFCMWGVASWIDAVKKKKIVERSFSIIKLCKTHANF